MPSSAASKRYSRLTRFGRPIVHLSAQISSGLRCTPTRRAATSRTEATRAPPRHRLKGQAAQGHDISHQAEAALCPHAPAQSQGQKGRDRSPLA